MNIEKIKSIWLSSPQLDEILSKHDIDKEFFMKHFGLKVIRNIEDIYHQKAPVDGYPIMYVFTRFFRKKKIFFHEVEQICQGLIESIKEVEPEDMFIDLEIIIKEKLEIVREDIEYDNPFVFDANLLDDEDRLKDIRFSSLQDLSSNDLVKLLEDSQYTKIELLQEQIDRLFILLDNLEDKDAKTIKEELPKVISKYIIFKELIASIALFPIIVKSFENLIEFLETVDEEILKDYSKRSLLILMLSGLTADISNWLDTVFIKQEADDVYYFDASFANNCLEIELQCGKNVPQKEEIDIDEKITNDEELMFFDL